MIDRSIIEKWVQDNNWKRYDTFDAPYWSPDDDPYSPTLRIYDDHCRVHVNIYEPECMSFVGEKSDYYSTEDVIKALNRILDV